VSRERRVVQRETEEGERKGRIFDLEKALRLLRRRIHPLCRAQRINFERRPVSTRFACRTHPPLSYTLAIITVVILSATVVDFEGPCMASRISRAVERSGADLPRPRIFRFIDPGPARFFIFAEACCLVASKQAFVCFVPFHAAALARCCSAPHATAVCSASSSRSGSGAVVRGCLPARRPV
jgi:hypothetical protein